MQLPPARPAHSFRELLAQPANSFHVPEILMDLPANCLPALVSAPDKRDDWFAADLLPRMTSAQNGAPRCQSISPSLRPAASKSCVPERRQDRRKQVRLGGISGCNIQNTSRRSCRRNYRAFAWSRSNLKSAGRRPRKARRRYGCTSRPGCATPELPLVGNMDFDLVALFQFESSTTAAGRRTAGLFAVRDLYGFLH